MRETRHKTPTRGELEAFEFNRRYEVLCAFIGWDKLFRALGRALMEPDSCRRGWSVQALADHVNSPRKTVLDRLRVMQKFGVAEVRGDTWFATSRGTDIHIRAHREFVLIARGLQDGVSQGLMADLLTLGDGWRFDALTTASFRPIIQEIRL